MFFWLEFGNAQKKMFNLNCRCDILRDHIARICLSECTEYIRTKTREVKSSLEAAELNLSVLEEQIQKAEAEAAEGEAEAAAAGTEEAALERENTEKLIAEIKDLIQTRNYQLKALEEASQKVVGAKFSEIDACNDAGVVQGLGQGR